VSLLRIDKTQGENNESAFHPKAAVAGILYWSRLLIEFADPLLNHDLAVPLMLK
jgi:hypothetical protein